MRSRKILLNTKGLAKIKINSLGFFLSIFNNLYKHHGVEKTNIYHRRRSLNIVINGENISLGENKILLDFLKEKQIPINVVIVEYNCNIISDYQISLKDGDRIEIIRMVGGG